MTRHRPPPSLKRKSAIRCQLEQVFADGLAAGLMPDELISLGQEFERWGYEAKERDRKPQEVPACDSAREDAKPPEAAPAPAQEQRRTIREKKPITVAVETTKAWRR
jgi:hypothetical protein